MTGMTQCTAMRGQWDGFGAWLARSPVAECGPTGEAENVGFAFHLPLTQEFTMSIWALRSQSFADKVLRTFRFFLNGPFVGDSRISNARLVPLRRLDTAR